MEPEQPPGRTIVWAVGRWEKIREMRGGGFTFSSSLVFTPDARLLITSLRLKTWDINTGQELTGLEESWDGNCVVLSPDAKCLATIGREGHVTFIDMTGRKLLARHRVHRFHGRAVAFSPDGRLLASGAEDIVLWDAATQTKLLRLSHTAQVWGLAFSPDGKWLVSTHDDGAILIWDVAEREAVANLNEHHASVRAVAFSPDGKRLASASEDRSIIIWDAERVVPTRHLKEAVLAGHSTRVTAAAFSPDGRLIASCDQDGVVILWDLARRKALWTFQYRDINNDAIVSYCLAFSPDGRLVAVSHGVYETAGGRQIADLHAPATHRLPWLGQIYGLAFSSDGRRLACVTEYGFLLLLNTETWQLLDSVELNNTHLITISFSPDGKFLVTGEDEGNVRLWQAGPLREAGVIGRHSARIKSVAFSPDGSEVASAGDDQMIALWDVDRRSLVTRIGAHTSPVLSVAFSPDGKKIASGEHDKSVRMYTRRRSLWGYRMD